MGRIKISRSYIAVWGAVFLCFGALVGCQNVVKRGQSQDDVFLPAAEPDTSKTKYVARICKMAGLNFKKIEGVAVVSNLDGTGSPAKPGALRERLLKDLETIETPRPAEELLKSKNTEMVLVKGLLPPGVRVGDRFDLEIFPIPETNATSLEGGYIQRMRLRPTAVLGGTVKDGHVEGLGKGPVVTQSALISSDKVAHRLSGLVLGGGVARTQRDLTLLIRKASSSIRVSTAISQAINERFTIATSSGLQGVANAQTDKIIELKIPSQYRYNVGRYAQVISNVAYLESNVDEINRLDELEASLNNPVTAGFAAIRLEAIGKKAIPAFKRALSSSNIQISFAAAQALVYLGLKDGIEALELAARTEPAFRWQAFTALITLDSATADGTLERLLSDNNAEARYGAFRAIRLRNPNSPLVVGTVLADGFRLCVVDNTSDPLLHFSGTEVPEIVIFNDSQTVDGKFLYVESGLTVKGNDDGTVSVNVYRRDDSFNATCSDRISDVIQTVAQAGYGYEALLKIFQKAMKEGTLKSRLVIDATPKVNARYQTKGPQDTIAGDGGGVIQDRTVKPASWWSSVRERFSRNN